MKKILYTNHANYQIHERKISPTDIVSALKSPDKVIKQDNFRKRIIKIIAHKKKKYALVVICKAQSSDYLIITAFITSKIKKYLT